MIIMDGKVLKQNFIIPTIFEASGSYALELAISKAIEMYYGVRIKAQIEEILRIRLSEDEIQNNFKVYQEMYK